MKRVAYEVGESLVVDDDRFGRVPKKKKKKKKWMQGPTKVGRYEKGRSVAIVYMYRYRPTFFSTRARIGHAMTET
jgi:hypothetical protein